MATRAKSRGTVNTPYMGPYGTPLAHVQYREGRHLDPQRIPFHRHEQPVSLRLLDLSKESLENVRKIAASIKRLLAPSLKLKTVPDSLIAYLEHLERLDLGYNRLTDSSFPDSMKALELLVELRLNDNQLTRVPACLRLMRSLTRLDLSNNQLETASGLERLKKIQFLVLDNNHLNSVFKEISGLRKLEMLHCSSNYLRDVPRDVRNLRHLKDLDLSNNRIVLLPTDVFLLPRLDRLDASQNQIAKVPSFNVKVQNKHWISSVDLSDNHVVKFPGHLMTLSHKLDLSANKVKALSWAALKKVDGDRDQELLLEFNPLGYPPLDVCQSGLKTILRFFQESQAEVKTYQGVKVLVIGSQGSGKSSLIHSLVDQQARLFDDVIDTAPGIDAYEMSFDYDVEDGKPGKSLNLCLWDFCGEPFYLYPHYLFHEQPAITVLTFSVPDYSPQLFHQQVGSWFDWMIAKTNKLVVILVGTKADKVPAKRVTQVTREVREKLASHLQHRQSLIESRIKDIEKRPVISPTLSEQLKAYMKLLQAKFTVQTEVIPTSCKTFSGFDKLRVAIEVLANERKLFPNVMRVIPTFWVEVENWLEEKGNAMVVPVMRWEEFSEEVTQRFGMKHLLTSITQHLHESGKVLWFSNVPSLKDLVFLRPSWLFDVLRQFFRHDLEALAFTPDDTLKVIGFTPSRFERLKQEVVQEGVVDRELLKGLLVSLMPADVHGYTGEVLRILTENLEMGYPVNKRNSRGNSYSFKMEKDSEGAPVINKLLIPWFRTCAEPTSFRHQWAQLSERRHLAVYFQFPCYMPPGLFELMTVRAHAEKHKLTFLAHWGGGLHARHDEEKVQLMLMYFREGAQNLEMVDGDEDEEETDEDEKLMLSRNLASETAQKANKDDSATKTAKEPHVTSEKALTSSESDVTSRHKPPLIRNDSADSFDSDDSDYVYAQGLRKRRSLRHIENDLDMPDTIDELDEDAEIDEPDHTESQKKSAINHTLSDSSLTNGVSRTVSGRGFSAEEVEQTAEEAGRGKERANQRRRRPTESEGDGSVIVRFEVRDNSEDVSDQTPASSMWNLLLPLLTDFEELLQGYTGVLVERRTECPLCGEGSFVGEWLTPKETQGLNTRPCEACHQHVDTAFLVQPRGKKRDEVMRSLIRRTIRRRGAAVTSQIDDMQRVAPLNPRRAALSPLDISGDGSLRRLLGHRGSADSDTSL
ncbi:hypothetical protein ACOMHN_013781 [Nucella lapillus]